ncbi:UNVERIFIED_CONTAM: hypothetical protein Sradi_6236900 [Sesamum radiatum]|uniref:Uncharacterized protein n=1 Tax=Sesamum radiatum TaxID=300843 RepID=A0AAW2KBD3_SESRA
MEDSLVNNESFCSRSLGLQEVLSARGHSPARAEVAADLAVDEMPRRGEACHVCSPFGPHIRRALIVA